MGKFKVKREKRICPNCKTLFEVRYTDDKKFCSRSCGAIFNRIGKHHTEETRRKLSESHKGKRVYEMTDEIKRKMSEAHKGKHPKNEFKKGHIVSEETKKKISLANKISLKNYRPPQSIIERMIKGNKNWWKNKNSKGIKERNIKISLALKGKPKSGGHIKNMSLARKGRYFFKNDSWIKNHALSLKRFYQTPKGIERRKQMREITKSIRSKQIFPSKDTTIEQKIQDFLKVLKIEFFTHQHIDIGHGYQCDIFIPSMNMIIECFGDYWHKYPVGRDIDKIRCQELREKGYKVFVFWEKEIRNITINEFKNKLRLS